MSGYTIGEIIIWLVLAAALGFALGWIARELLLRAKSRDAAAVRSPAPVAEPGTQAPVEKPVVKKAAAKRPPAKKSAATKTAAKKAPAKKTATRKTAAQKAAKKAPAKKATPPRDADDT